MVVVEGSRAGAGRRGGEDRGARRGDGRGGDGRRRIGWRGARPITAAHLRYRVHHPIDRPPSAPPFSSSARRPAGLHKSWRSLRVCSCHLPPPSSPPSPRRPHSRLPHPSRPFLSSSRNVATARTRRVFSHAFSCVPPPRPTRWSFLTCRRTPRGGRGTGVERAYGGGRHTDKREGGQKR